MDKQLLFARVALVLGIVISALITAYTALAYMEVSAAKFVFAKEDTLAMLQVQGGIALGACTSMVIGLILQGLKRFKTSWMVLLIVPIVGIIEFVGLGGFFTGFLALFAGLAAHMLRQHDIEMRMDAMMESNDVLI